MYKIRKNLTEKAILDYYYAFIYPYVSFNVEVWGGTFETFLKPLIIQHKRIIRTMTWSRARDHTTPLFKKLGILKVHDLFKYRLCIKMFKLLAAGRFATAHGRNTRSSNLAAPKFHRLALTRHAFSFTGPSAWNDFPPNLRSIKSFASFKRALRVYHLDQ